MNFTKTYDVVVIGAGAAGMMCAIEAGKRARSVLVIEHNREPGEKIRISGGGRCNFTNVGASAANYISANPKFVLSALSRFGPNDFISLLARHNIAWHEKARGALFCDGPARQIVDLLVEQMERSGVELWSGCEVRGLGRSGDKFLVTTGKGAIVASSLVVASGGKSIPKMGASNFGYKTAEQFGLRVTKTSPGLAPLTFGPQILEQTKPLAGVSVEARIVCAKRAFNEALLFTHRGLSGPAILQISSYWREGEAIVIDMAPQTNVMEMLRKARQDNGRQDVVTALARLLARRLAQMVVGPDNGRLGDKSDKALAAIAGRVNNWRVKPTGSEGYRVAEVTLGGVDTRDLDPKTLAARSVGGLYFIGEVVDVTGWLGGYNFQWAWSSGWAAGQAV
ncbi:Uncharacterized protein YhiN [hydrothermal vent metagenome]|uniref:Uncharacterized protein YhiN n=1 Tax=hydrothermal vent metagenome TaxID=652676 RepID=A0A3B0U8V3_9ZZZZ